MASSDRWGQRANFGGGVTTIADENKTKTEVSSMQTTTKTHRGSTTDRRLLISGLTLIALGLSVLFLNSRNTLFVRTTVGLFWGTFFLILNWSSLVQALRSLKQLNVRNGRSSQSSTQW